MPTHHRTNANKKVYGASKAREMQRSVLPSTDRRDARNSLDRVRRSARRGLAARLAAYRGGAGAVADRVLDDPADLAAWPRHVVRDEVLERRYHDKVGPLIRWGRARTRALPQAERLDALRRLVPANVIGKHALSHLERCSDLRNPAEPLGWLEAQRNRNGWRDPRSRLEPLVRAALADGRHGELNRWLKAHSEGVRLLAGIHDVEPFVHGVDPGLVRDLVAFLDRAVSPS